MEQGGHGHPRNGRRTPQRGTAHRAGVLMYTDSTGFGGAELHLADLAAALAGGRYEPAVLLHPGVSDERVFALLDRRGIPVLTAPLPRGKADAGRHLRLRSALARRRAASGRLVLHCHQATPYSNHHALALARTLGIGTVITDHAYYLASTSRLLVRRRLINALADQNIVVSKAVGRAVIDELGQSPEKVAVVHNGIEADGCPGPEERSERRREMRAHLGIPPDAAVVGTVGRQAPEKNLTTLVRAMGAVAAGDRTVYVVLCGEGDPQYQESLRGIAREAGWGDRLVVPGRLDDLQSALASFDVFVLPSLTEGMPLALMEAMLACLPVVATAVGGVPELVTSGRQGLLVADPSDETGLAEAVAGLLADPARRAAMGALGAVTVRSRFAFEHTVERVEAVYDHVLRIRGSGA